jgi:hypothetical protein
MCVAAHPHTKEDTCLLTGTMVNLKAEMLDMPSADAADHDWDVFAKAHGKKVCGLAELWLQREDGKWRDGLRPDEVCA